VIYLNQLGMICSLGNRRENIGRRVLDAAQSGVTMIENYLPGRSLPLGRVEAAVPLPSLDEFPCATAVATINSPWPR
jgi:hypothetical protein